MIKAMKKSCNTIFVIVKKIRAVSKKTSNDLKPFSIIIDMNFGEKIILKYGNSRLGNSFKSLVLRRFEVYPDMVPDERQLDTGTHINNYINRFINNKSVVKIENTVFKYLIKNNTPLYFNAVQYVNKETRAQLNYNFHYNCATPLVDATKATYKSGSNILSAPKVPFFLNGVNFDHYLTGTDNTTSYLHSADNKSADARPQIRSLDFINRLHVNISEKKDSKSEMEVSKEYLLEAFGNNKPPVLIPEKKAGEISNEQFIYHSKEGVNAPGYLPNFKKGKPERTEYVNNDDGLIDRHENISGVLNIEHRQKTFLKDINEIQTTNYNSERVNLTNLDLLSNYSPGRFVNYLNRKQTGHDFKEIHSGILGKSIKESPEKKKRYMTFENLIEIKTFEFVKNQSIYNTSRTDTVSDEKSGLDMAVTGFEVHRKAENSGNSMLIPLKNKSIPIGVMQGGTDKESLLSNSNAGSNNSKNIGFSDSQDTLIFHKPYMKETAKPYEESIDHEIHIKEDAANKTYTMERETQRIKEFGSEEINLLADKVFKALEKRIAIKKDKKGVW